jgi:hypothetical protein
MKRKKPNQKRKQPEQQPTPQPGPKPDLLKIEGDWEEAVKKSLEKEKPPEGWPK